MTLMLVYRCIIWICCYYEAFIYGLVEFFFENSTTSVTTNDAGDGPHR